jgi:hypothetical protein
MTGAIIPAIKTAVRSVERIDAVSLVVMCGPRDMGSAGHN